MADKERLIVASKVREYIRAKGCQTSSDAVDALNQAVVAMLEKAAERAKTNKRATVRPQDF